MGKTGKSSKQRKLRPQLSNGPKQEVRDHSQASSDGLSLFVKNFSHFCMLCYYTFIVVYDLAYEAVTLRDNGLIPPEQVTFFPGVCFRAAYLTHINQVSIGSYAFDACN